MRSSTSAPEAASLADRPEFRLPRRIVSFHTGQPVEVDLGHDLDA